MTQSMSVSPRDRLERLPLTVVIAARNEAVNIAGCIDSVRWADEIIVAEYGSTDETATIARESGARVIQESAETIGIQRNNAIAQAKHPWIFVVDADERGTVALRNEIRDILANPTYDAYRIPRRNIFLGKEIRHGGWDRDRPVRLFRSNLRYNHNRVHEHVEVTTPVGVLREGLLHYPYVSIDQYFDKFNRYSQWWADQRFERGKRVSPFSLFIRPPGRFLKMYILQRGFLDGAHGLVLALLASASVLAKYVRLWGKQWNA
jgi:glycosyltransferase involved in cell wall biosynthesis